MWFGEDECGLRRLEVEMTKESFGGVSSTIEGTSLMAERDRK